MSGIITKRLALAFVALSAAYGDTTYTFQNGINGYKGAGDASIDTQYAQYNGGNGAPWSGEPELGCYTVSGSGGYTARYILKFGNLSIPSGSHVVSASLAISLDAWFAGGNLTGFYLKNAWDPASGKLGWIHRNASSDWAAPGASASGVDTVAGKTFAVPPLRAVGPQTLKIPLDLATVQSWIDSPAASQGIMLVNNIPGDIVRPISTVGKQSQRPKLTIVVASASGVQLTLSPASATLQPGQTQQFAATVTGSSNTAVTWTATGGMISSAGLFTAGSNAGNFVITATSAADTTKTASAQVTIQVPQTVQISISPKTATLQAGQTQQFTATVTGSSNTAVTWTATGGTISSAGLFTAGSGAGNFAVNATSVADTTKSASAQVTVQVPQPVQVSVSPSAITLAPGQTQ